MSVPSVLFLYEPNLRVIHWIHSYAAQVGLNATLNETQQVLQENLVNEQYQLIIRQANNRIALRNITKIFYDQKPLYDIIETGLDWCKQLLQENISIDNKDDKTADILEAFTQFKFFLLHAAAYEATLTSTNTSRRSSSPSQYHNNNRSVSMTMRMTPQRYKEIVNNLFELSHYEELIENERYGNRLGLNKKTILDYWRLTHTSQISHTSTRKHQEDRKMKEQIEKKYNR